MLTRRYSPAAIAAALGFALAAAAPAAAQTSVLRVRVEDGPASTRLIVTSTAALPFAFEAGPATLLINFETKASPRVRRDPFESRRVKSIGWARGEAGFTMAVTTAGPFAFEHSVRRQPFELVVEIKMAGEGTGGARVPAVSTAENAAPRPAADTTPPVKVETAAATPPPTATLAAVDAPERKAGVEKASDSRVLNDKAAETSAAEADLRAMAVDPALQGRRVKTIIIDPGHGGIETGAKGEFGALEKDITLAISLKLKAAIERGLAARVFMTRDKDEDVALERRAALANNHEANLFISLHANGSRRKNAQGSETFFLSLNATDEETRRLAYLENESGRLDASIQAEDQDDIKLILWDLAQTAYLRQSARLAEIVQAELNELLGTRDRGVKQAPFKVLTGVACPAILVEVAFISNPDEERKLQDEKFQESVVQAIYRGLVKYLQLYP